MVGGSRCVGTGSGFDACSLLLPRFDAIEGGDSPVDVVESEYQKWQHEKRVQHLREFKVHEKDWLRLKVDWVKEFPELAGLTGGDKDYKFDVIFDLL